MRRCFSAALSAGAVVLWIAGACGGPPSPGPGGTSDGDAEPREPISTVPERTEASTSSPAAGKAAHPAWRNEDGSLVEPDHWTPGPAYAHASRDPEARLAQDLECRRCHADAAHQWESSQHAGAWSDRAFARAFEAEPRAFCQRCHAPEEDPATPTGEVSAAAAAIGIGCVTCHVQPGHREVWAAPRNDDSGRADAPAPHPIVRSEAMAGPAACGGCHEFGFPDNALRDRPLAMQSTLSEHQRSTAADQSCASCHMPLTSTGRRSHTFDGAHDRGMLTRALVVDAARPTPTEVTVRLAPGEVGHAVPTGDLLRRLMVEVTVEGPGDTPDFQARRYYGRRFAPARQVQGISLRAEVADERVGVGPDGGVRQARFTLPPTLARRPVRWRVVHQRVALASRDPRRAPVEGQLDMARGVLTASE